MAHGPLDFNFAYFFCNFTLFSSVKSTFFLKFTLFFIRLLIVFLCKIYTYYVKLILVNVISDTFCNIFISVIRTICKFSVNFHLFPVKFVIVGRCYILTYSVVKENAMLKGDVTAGRFSNTLFKSNITCTRFFNAWQNIKYKEEFP